MELSATDLPSAEHLVSLWLQTSDHHEKQLIGTRLISEQAMPVIRNVVRYKLRTTWSRQREEDEKDLCSEIIVRLWQQLQNLQKSEAVTEIKNFRNYVAVIAHNACAEFLRQKFPARQRLKDRLRYVLTRHPKLSLWENQRRVWLSGLQLWQQKQIPPLTRNQLFLPPENLLAQAHSKEHFVSFIEGVFQHFAAPVEFDDLISFVMELTEPTPNQPYIDLSVLEHQMPAHAKLPGGAAFNTSTEQRLYLQQIWAEICKLPLANRTALLLNLHDADEKGLVALLADLRIVSLQGIADALALGPEQFASLWQTLPLDDTQIAALLGITRQQVINLRKAARRWLTRQLNFSPPS